MNPIMQNRIAARHLAAQGQGNDDTLVHMSSKEVQGLQALAQKHGLSMTQNPRTGLPEAFSLDSLLPAIAGVGLTAMTGLPAWEIGLGVGGADVLASGSLQKGLMAGLGAYGGADVGNALSAAGSATATPATNFISAAPSIGGDATDALANISPEDLAAPPGEASYTPPAPTTLSNMSSGLGSLTDASGRSAFMQSLGNAGPFSGAGANQMFNAAAVAANPLFYGQGTSMPSSATTDLQNTVRPWSFSQSANPSGMGTTYNQPLKQTWTAGTPYVAAAGGGLMKGPSTGEGLHRTVGELRGVERLTKFANGGISDLGSYSDGGQLLRGPGDGVSDDIPAQIGQHQPARLAEGEFVVPARIVSELGNGSTNAGAKQLYAMIDRIQSGRRHTMGGKHAYANDTNAAKDLPA